MTDRHALGVARVEPVAGAGARPFWSIMIPTRGNSRYLAETLESVLAEDRGPDEMQIEVVDNAGGGSDVERLIERVGRGRVDYFGQRRPVSMARNWNTCVTRARGQWVHLLHDDDLVVAGAYDAYRRFVADHPDVDLVFARAMSTDESGERRQLMYSPPNVASSGVLHDALPGLIAGNFICAPAAVVRRDAYVALGGFAESLRFCPDWEMWMRIAGAGPLGYLHDAWIVYRVHGESETRSFERAAEDIEEIVRVIDVGVDRLAPATRSAIRRSARRHYARYTNRVRAALQAHGDHPAALRQACWGLRLDPSVRNVMRTVKSAILTAVAARPGPPAAGATG